MSILHPNRLKIAHVTNNWTPYNAGVVSSITGAVDQFQQYGHDLALITLNFLADRHKDPSWVLRMPTFMRCSLKNNYFAIPWRPDYHVMNSLKEYRPDIIHVHHPWLLGKSALKAARSLNIPIVFTYHTFYEGYAHYALLPGVMTRGLIRSSSISFANSVDAVIAPSLTIKEYLRAHGCTRPIMVIPSSMHPRYSLDEQEVYAKTTDYPIKLLYVGRFAKEKNLDFLLQVLASLDQERFFMTFIGFGPDYQKVRHAAYARYGLRPECVQFLYSPEKETIAKYYRQADLFLFSSTTETQGIVLAEAMASGTPVIALKGPGVVDIIDNGQNGFVVDSVDQMVDRIYSVESSPLLYQKLARGAWQTSRAYQPARFYQRLLDLYSRVLSSERPKMPTF